MRKGDTKRKRVREGDIITVKVEIIWNSVGEDQ